MTENYYKLLEVPRSASPEEIKEAFIKLIRQVHPDVLANGPEYWKHQAEEKSKDINEAYGVLSDPAKRRRYDRQLDVQAEQHAARSTQDDKQDASSSTEASPHRPARSWRAELQNFRKGRIAALLCFLVITAFVWFLAALIAGRRTSTAASSAVPEIQSQASATASTLPARPKSAEKWVDPSNAPAQHARGPYSIDVDASTGTQEDAAGEVIQWNPRTKSWQPTKALGPGIAGKEVQSNMQWDPETNSWQRTDPATQQTR